ncbi:MAG TPA: hypothetical protein VMM78_01730 [Thermomicrobiales bacterium]|nr:hypothetical protein [Thermomicrobiales bacterium]
MSQLLISASDLTRVWVRYYTRGMPPEVRDTRRAEIESDLWEQAADARDSRASATALSVFDRLVGGIPADLSWRRQIRRNHPLLRPNARNLDYHGGIMTRVAERIVAGLAILLGVFCLSLALQGLLGLMGGSYIGNVLYGVAALTVAALLLGGLATSRRFIPLGGVALALGALSMVFMLYWMWFAVIIVVAPVIWLGVQRARQTSGSGGMRPA